jgi:hypothetical protein
MEQLDITQRSVEAWSAYRVKFGFVPDPMILRAGEIFLNGSSGSAQLGADSFSVWHALEENIAGIVDFFDMITTFDRIPIINYRQTYDGMSLANSIEQLLSNKLCNVEIALDVYIAIKEGALVNLAALDLARLPPGAAGALKEMAIFGYDWKPELAVGSNDDNVKKACTKLASLDDRPKQIAQFLLGGLIFGSYAQASRTRHLIQPKRSRLYLGLTAAAGEIGTFGAQEEDGIFNSAEAALAGSKVETRRLAAMPPVLPYLLAQKPMPQKPADLLTSALEFPYSAVGRDYLKAARAIREDGIDARQIEDLSQHEHKTALDYLAPYSKLDTKRSCPLDIKLKSELIGLPPGAEATFKLGIPTWLKVWWNDKIPFGGMHKTFRRMWMAKESYDDLSTKLYNIWSATQK